MQGFGGYLGDHCFKNTVQTPREILIENLRVIRHAGRGNCSVMRLTYWPKDKWAAD